MIKTFNEWFDALQAPYRFLLAVALALIGIAGLASGDGYVMLASTFYLGVLLYLRIKGEYDAAT